MHRRWSAVHVVYLNYDESNVNNALQIMIFKLQLNIFLALVYYHLERTDVIPLQDAVGFNCKKGPTQFKIVCVESMIYRRPWHTWPCNKRYCRLSTGTDIRLQWLNLLHRRLVVDIINELKAEQEVNDFSSWHRRCNGLLQRYCIMQPTFKQRCLNGCLLCRWMCAPSLGESVVQWNILLWGAV